MAQDLVQIRHKGETVFSSDNPLVKMAFSNAVMNLDVTVKNVTLKPKVGKPYPAKEFKTNKLEIVKLMGDTYFLWLQKGTEVLIVKE